MICTLLKTIFMVVFLSNESKRTSPLKGYSLSNSTTLLPSSRSLIDS